MIDASGIEQRFSLTDNSIDAVRRADFQVLENTFNIIYGPSGSGKSTLLNIITGIQKPSSGQVMIEGRDIYKLTPDELAFFRANRVGIVYQTNYWVQSLNVLENVSLPLNFLGYSQSTAAKIALMTLDRVGMASAAKKYPYLLSGGEQQRVAMARALANNPLFIIADEPTGNLDTENGDKMMNLLQNCKTEFRCTIILVTHNLEYIPLADNLMYMQDGILHQTNEQNIAVTTERLLKDIKQRINVMSEAKQHARRL